MRRLLVTGSRNWTDRDVIDRALADVWHEWGRPSDAVLVVGRCRDGADAIAEEIWAARGLPVEPHPARWNYYGKQAGFRRNSHMVNLGADLCLAFIAPCIKHGCPEPALHGSHGARDCGDKATEAGIDVRPYFTPELGWQKGAA